MRGAFVIRLGPETRPEQRLFEGWVEEVDSCQELRFHSTDELLNFFAERFQVAFGAGGQKQEPCSKDHRAICDEE